MKQKQLPAWLFIVLFAAIASMSVMVSSNTKTMQWTQPLAAALNQLSVNGQKQAPEGFYQVVRVVDGDTLDVRMNGKRERVRLIGINTPETVDPRKSVQCFGKEASAKAKQLMEKKYVRLERDRSQTDKDKYGRLLRYVYLEDNTLINRQLIVDGYAYEYTYEKSYAFMTEFKNAQQQAQAEKRGLWADGACNK